MMFAYSHIQPSFWFCIWFASMLGIKSELFILLIWMMYEDQVVILTFKWNHLKGATHFTTYWSTKYFWPKFDWKIVRKIVTFLSCVGKSLDSQFVNFAFILKNVDFKQKGKGWPRRQSLHLVSMLLLKHLVFSQILILILIHIIWKNVNTFHHTNSLS